MRPLSKLREREAALDERASLIDTDTNLSFGETLEIAARGMFFVRHFYWRYIAKALLAFFAAAIPVTIMPWPVKIVIDHVVCWAAPSAKPRGIRRSGTRCSTRSAASPRSRRSPPPPPYSSP